MSPEIRERLSKVNELSEALELLALLLERLELISQENELLRQENAELRAKVARLEKNSSNSSKPPSSDITKPQSEQRQKGKRKQGGQSGHKGHWRREFSSAEIDKRQEVKLERCPDCRSKLHQTDNTESFSQAELVEKPVVVTEYLLREGYCPCCDKTVRAKLPEGVIPGQMFGPRLTSLFGYMKAAMGASVTELSEFSRDVLSLNLCRASVQNSIFKVSEAIAAPYEELAKGVPEQKALNIDETGWKENGARRWAWVFCNRKIAFFVISKSRGCQVLLEVLGENFLGALTSDFFSAYTKYASPKQQFCLAHLIRDIKFLTTLCDEHTKLFGLRLLAYMRRVFKLWHSRHTLSDEQWKKKTKRFKRDLLNYLWAQNFERKTDACRIQRRCLKHFKALFIFLDHPDIYDPTNNLAERTLRHLVRLRRISQGSRAKRGSLWTARAASVLASCRLQKKSPWTFFLQAVNAQYFNALQPSLLPE